MDVDEFEKTLLKGRSIDRFEQEILKNVVWQYYKAKYTAYNVIQALNKHIDSMSQGLVTRLLNSYKRRLYCEARAFVSRVLLDMKDPDVEFWAIRRLLDEAPNDIKRLQELLFDDDRKMTVAMNLLSCYCEARGLSTRALLEQFPVEQYCDEVYEGKAEERPSEEVTRQLFQNRH